MKDGGPAFPTFPYQLSTDKSAVSGVDGMTLRDYFAGEALNGMVSALTKFRDDMGCAEIILNRPNDISELAYLYADAMLAVRERKP